MVHTYHPSSWEVGPEEQEVKVSSSSEMFAQTAKIFYACTFSSLQPFPFNYIFSGCAPTCGVRGQHRNPFFPFLMWFQDLSSPLFSSLLSLLPRSPVLSFEAGFKLGSRPASFPMLGLVIGRCSCMYLNKPGGGRCC